MNLNEVCVTTAAEGNAGRYDDAITALNNTPLFDC
jgi:hypothetical protein